MASFEVELFKFKVIIQNTINVIIKVGNVVYIIYLIWVYKSVPEIAEARFVVSLKGDILSPKYAPEITAPAVMLGGMLKALPTDTSATPIVAEVMYELPAVKETIAVITSVNGKKTDGSIKLIP